jgi:hypothetical protein
VSLTRIEPREARALLHAIDVAELTDVVNISEDLREELRAIAATDEVYQTGTATLLCSDMTPHPRDGACGEGCINGPLTLAP